MDMFCQSLHFYSYLKDNSLSNIYFSFIVASFIMESIYYSLTNKCTFY